MIETVSRIDFIIFTCIYQHQRSHECWKMTCISWIIQWFYGWSWLLNWGGQERWVVFFKPLKTMVWIRGRHLRRSRTYYAPKIMAFFSGLQRSLNVEPCWTPKSVLDEHKSWKKDPCEKVILPPEYKRLNFTAEPSKKGESHWKYSILSFLNNSGEIKKRACAHPAAEEMFRALHAILNWDNAPSAILPLSLRDMSPMRVVDKVYSSRCTAISNEPKTILHLS